MDYIDFTICCNCKHFTEYDLKNNCGLCKAYPQGIPDNINDKWGNHLTVAPGQKGDYVFEPEDSVFKDIIEKEHERLKAKLKKQQKK